MAMAQMDTVIRHLRRAVLRQDGAGRTDGQLLASFINQKDEAAFEALVRRHGPMVFGVCRRVVGNHHDAEDAFQATFLVLARKASSVKQPQRLANWLHGVALRTAMKAKTMTAKRRGREKQVTDMPEPEAAQQDQWRDLQPLLDQELNGLPENYRLPILLCDLEGKSIKEAAQQLGWPQGTLAGRLARGRKMLAKRLANRGVVLSAGSLAAVVSQNVASAGVPTSLMSSTIKAAMMIGAGQATVAGVVPAKVAALMEGVLKSMMLTKLSKAAVGGLVVLCLCGLGIGGFQASSAQETKTTTTTTTTTTITKESKTDPRLEGCWKDIRSEQEGKVQQLIDNGVVRTFVGGRYECKRHGDLLYEGTYTTAIDPKGERNELNITFTKSEHPGYTGKTLHYIYRIEGHKIHLAYSNRDMNSRPVTFSGAVGSGTTYFVFQRISPKTTAKRVKATEAAEEEQEDTDKSTTAKECMKQLQGTWKVMTTMHPGGHDAKSITFSRNRYSFVVGQQVVNGTFQFVNLTTEPKSFDLTNDAGGTAHAIFQIDGNTLYYCGHNDPKARPTDFNARSGDGRYGHIFKRVEP